MSREYFCGYHSYLETMEALTDEECGRLFRACLIYSRTGTAPELCGNERFVWPSFKAKIDEDEEKRRAVSAKRAESGRKGGKAKQAIASNCYVCQANEAKAPSPSPSSPPPPLLPPSSSPPVPPVSPPPYSPPSAPSPVPPSRDRARRAPAKAPEEPKVQWAEYVTMTNAEHDKLLAAHGPADTARLIEILDNYKGAYPKKRHYESDYRAILSWVVDRLEEDKRKAPKAFKPYEYDYDTGGMESL